MEDEYIIKQTLTHLDGWILEDEAVELTGAEYNKTVTADEVINFYNIAYNYALSYIKLNEFPELIQPIPTALFMWTAGLLWNKYNIRSNNQIDETNTLGFGDKLIVQAKEMLKSFKYYNFYAY